MNSILAVDAAWTASEPSGVSLLCEKNGAWCCVALTPSYESFNSLADGVEVDWDQKPVGNAPDINRLLDSASKLLNNQNVSVITVDMPISSTPIIGRRNAENAISKAFGAKGCGAHSPSIFRPGKISSLFLEDCIKNGFKHGVISTLGGQTKCILEVYPHPALIDLLRLDYRLTYKAGNTSRFWPDLSIEQRKINLLSIYNEILTALSEKIKGIPLVLPDDLIERPFAHFKRFEDSLDALICGWVGMKYFAKEAKAYGDDTGAIWVPD